MQGLGKTERGEPGRDIDLTSLRSTMPASGPLQVSDERGPIEGREGTEGGKKQCEWWNFGRIFSWPLLPSLFTRSCPAAAPCLLSFAAELRYVQYM